MALANFLLKTMTLNLSKSVRFFLSYCFLMDFPFPLLKNKSEAYLNYDSKLLISESLVNPLRVNLVGSTLLTEITYLQTSPFGVSMMIFLVLIKSLTMASLSLFSPQLIQTTLPIQTKISEFIFEFIIFIFLLENFIKILFILFLMFSFKFDFWIQVCLLDIQFLVTLGIVFGFLAQF